VNVICHGKSWSWSWILQRNVINEIIALFWSYSLKDENKTKSAHKVVGHSCVILVRPSDEHKAHKPKYSDEFFQIRNIFWIVILTTEINFFECWSWISNLLAIWMWLKYWLFSDSKIEWIVAWTAMTHWSPQVCSDAVDNILGSEWTGWSQLHSHCWIAPTFG